MSDATSPPLEWPDGIRLEVRGAHGSVLIWRDDSRADDEGRWWFTGPDFALTWTQLWHIYGPALTTAVPLYPPNAFQAAVRPVYVVLGRNAAGAPHAWCFTDADDASDARDSGVGHAILPSVLLAPGVTLDTVTYYTGWARVGREAGDDVEPHINGSTATWTAPGAVIPLIAQRRGDDLDGLATPGADVVDMWCVGTDTHAVYADLHKRYSSVAGLRDALTFALSSRRSELSM